MQEHKRNCPDRATFDHYINVVGVKINEKKTRIEVKPPKINTNPFMKPEESWDDLDCPTYDPKKLAADKPILRITNGMTPAERRDFREQERKRLNAMEHFN